jgi:hypothetical protein
MVLWIRADLDSRTRLLSICLLVPLEDGSTIKKEVIHQSRVKMWLEDERVETEGLLHV